MRLLGFSSILVLSTTAPLPLVAGPPSGPPPGDRSPAAQKLEAGLSLQQSRRYEEALARLSEARTLGPPPGLEAEILSETGQTHYLRGQDAIQGKLPGVEPEPALREAVKTFEDLLKRFPKEEKAAEGVYRLASTYVLLDEPDKALAAYQRVFDDYPASRDRVWALVRLGICQGELDQPEKARATFNRVLREFPDRQGEVQKARRYLQELALVGQRAAPIPASRWILGNVGAEGIKTFDGEVRVLFFFATWCTNCKKELPHVRSLIKKLGPSGVIFLGVANPEDRKNTQSVEAYVEEHKLEFVDVALDPVEASWKPYHVSGFPAAVVIDRKGSIRWRGHSAFLSRPLLEKLLHEKG